MQRYDNAVETRTVVGPTDGPGDPKKNRYLLVVEGSSSRLVELPTSGAWTIGRLDDADLGLPDSSVSRRHARMFFANGAVTISDLGSHNGTRINGEAIVGTRPLVPGDVVAVGEVTLVLGSSLPSNTVMDAEPVVDSSAILSIGDRTIVVADPVMRRLYELLQKLAASDLPVLICGETGAGKENAALAVHHYSARKTRPFVSLNCAAFPDTLFESEVFGHIKGAFTGASTSKVGLLESADGGTVFLDEIGELSPSSQAKLLRFLDNKKLLRLGDVKERSVDVRVVAATNRKLADEVIAGRFRQDLLFRLSGATVTLPPLRDRPREIVALSNELLSAACARAQRTPPKLTKDVRRQLLLYPWPGNVRELKNAMDYLAATVSGASVDVNDLPAPIGPLAAGTQSALDVHDEVTTTNSPFLAIVAPADVPTSPGLHDDVIARPMSRRTTRPIAEEMWALERKRIEEALAATGGVQTKAAELIGMPLRTFVLRLKQHGILIKGRSL